LLPLSVAVFLSLLASSSAGTCSKPDDCATDSAGPLCIPIPINKTMLGTATECRACDPESQFNAPDSNCGCPIGQVCIKSYLVPKSYGMCQALSNLSIGKPCNPNINPYNIILTGANANSKLFCGYPVFDGTTFHKNEWIGACVLGKCLACDPSASILSPAPICLLDTRVCTVAGIVVDAPAEENSWAFAVQNPWLLFSCVMALILLIGSCWAMSVLRHKSPGAGSSGNTEKKENKKTQEKEKKKSTNMNEASAAGGNDPVMQVKEGWVVEATHDYVAEVGGPLQLSFKKGQKIHVTGNPTPTRWILGYLEGTSADAAGWFSADFVQVINPK